MKRIIKIICTAIFMFVIFMVPMISYGEKLNETISLYAKAAVLIDGDTNRILYEKNPHIQMPNASTTKILTCILAIENGNLEQVCEVSDYARAMPETKCGFYKGDEFYLKDLLYSLMLESHNDSAVAIAEAIGGNVNNFASMMNDKAAEIGCQNSYFITPNGLDAQDSQGNHGASAYDLALIMNYCRKNQTFLEITRTMNYTFADVKQQHTYSVSNKNSFLSMQEGVLSGKTGYTSKAGYCYVCSYQKEGKNYSLALLASGWPNNRTYKWKDASALIQYANKNYEKAYVGDPVSIVQIQVPMGILEKGHSFTYVTNTTVKSDGSKWEYLIGENDVITSEYIYEPTQLPVYKNQKAGERKYYINGEYAGCQELYYTETILFPDFKWSLCFFMKEFLQVSSF